MRPNISNLYYITHTDNLMSIMKRGILSHSRVEKDRISYTSISDGHILKARKSKIAPDGNSLWSFVNLFFYPRNPMLYRILREKPAKDVVVIAIDPIILNRNDVFITTGNARAWQSEILTKNEGLLRIKEIQKSFELERWADEDGSRARIMAECLVPDIVSPEYLQTIYAVSHKATNNIKARYPNIKVDIIPEPYMFFRPAWSKSINDLGAVKGSEFFSKMRNVAGIGNFVGVKHFDFVIKPKYHFVGTYYKMKRENLLDRVHWV